jgi:uncharacterized membrane protein
MNKSRLEAFSDGVFSIVMTLLIFDVKVPEIVMNQTDAGLWASFLLAVPHLLIFMGTFAVLSMMWTNHHFLFHSFAKTVDRKLNLLNLLYLMMVVLVPFSASFLGAYHSYRLPAIIFGLNLLAITFLSLRMLWYIKRSQELEHVERRTFNQARFRSMLSIGSYVLGVITVFVSSHASLFFFIFPIVFNIIPGTVDLTEKIFRLNFD